MELMAGGGDLFILDKLLMTNFPFDPKRIR